MIREKRNYCRICFKPINDYSLYNLLNNNGILCEECFTNFAPKFIHFRINGVNGLAIYEYDETIKELLFKFKGCFDIEMKDVFFDRYYRYLRLKYYGYYVVPVPSYYTDDLTRGFNHVVEIYNRLNLPMLKIIKKTKQEKQANKHKKERLEVSKILVGEDIEQVKNKKILIVDDVMTTGSSLSAVIDIIRHGHPKKIEVLVMAKNVEKRVK